MELREIIKFKDEKIKLLEEKLNKYTKIEKENEKFLETNNIKDDKLYDDFNIKLNEPIHILNTHSNKVICLILLKDGRLASGSYDNSIVIYNKVTFNPDLIIREHKGYLTSIIQLSSGELASSSHDDTIKIFNIKEKDYEVIQTLQYHTNSVYKIRELENKYLASCSSDCSIIFYLKDNNEYKKDYQISTDGVCYSFIQTKENEICYSSSNKKLYFFDLLERKIKAKIDNINGFSHSYCEWLIMIIKDLLLIPGENKLFIVNINHYNLVREINVPDSGFISSCCMLNQAMLITGDYNKTLRQWRIEGDNLIQIYKKDNSHGDQILSLVNLGNKLIVSGSSDKLIKVWNQKKL